jgi:hypothetical protein
MAGLAPASIVASRWHILYATDLLVAGTLEPQPLQGPELDHRLAVFDVLQRRLADQLQGVDIGDGQFLRLALAILHEVLPRHFVNAAMRDRLVGQILEASFEGMVHAPSDLGGGAGARLLFGYHLAHAARFIRTRVDAMAQAYARVEAPFLIGEERIAPIQVVLHALVAQQRVSQLGLALTPEEYSGTFARIRRHLQQHKELFRAFGGEQVLAEDEPFLAANLTARAYIQIASRHPPPVGGLRQPDTGLAGIYEPQDRRSAPVLGLPFGTLMLS